MNSLTRALILCCLLMPAAASAVEVTLQNDGFAGGSAAFQAGFVTGEVAASRFDPPGPFPMNLTGIQFLFGEIGIQQVVIVYIWEDNGGNAPGAEIYSEGFLATGSSSALNSINLAGAGVQVNGPFRVGLEFTHDGLPSVARDTDGTIDASSNFIRANGLGWYPSSLFGLTGDWIIRAVVEAATTDSPPDAPARPALVVAPNPFNPATQVSLELPAAGPLTLRVYDLRGRQVDSLLDGAWMPAGPQSIPYRTSLPSGVYLLQAISGDWSRTTKFTVVE